MIYLFIGQDPPSKDTQLNKIKQEFLNKSTEEFNLDTLYAKELRLSGLQERLLCLPVKSQKRIVIIKDAQNLREDIKEFILQYVKEYRKNIILILDISSAEKMGDFVNRLHRHAKTLRFKERPQVNTFTLGRWIALKKPDYALRALNQLLLEAERPERILGGLRYIWERDTTSRLEARRRLKLLLNCDIDIKTGRLKPAFALEKLVINLCGPRNPLH